MKITRSPTSREQTLTLAQGEPKGFRISMEVNGANVNVYCLDAEGQYRYSIALSLDEVEEMRKALKGKRT